MTGKDREWYQPPLMANTNTKLPGLCKDWKDMGFAECQDFSYIHKAHTSSWALRSLQQSEQFWGKPGAFSISEKPTESKLLFNNLLVAAVQFRGICSSLCKPSPPPAKQLPAPCKGIFSTTHISPPPQIYWQLLLLPKPVPENDTNCQMCCCSWALLVWDPEMMRRWA